MTDFRALCAELLEALENAIRVVYREDGTKHISTADPVITKADAALAQPEPQGPTDEEIGDWHDKCADLTRLGAADHYWAFDVEESDVIAIVHAALQRWGHHTSDHR